VASLWRHCGHDEPQMIVSLSKWQLTRNVADFPTMTPQFDHNDATLWPHCGWDIFLMNAEQDQTKKKKGKERKANFHQYDVTSPFQNSLVNFHKRNYYCLSLSLSLSKPALDLRRGKEKRKRGRKKERKIRGREKRKGEEDMKTDAIGLISLVQESPL